MSSTGRDNVHSSTSEPIAESNHNPKQDDPLLERGFLVFYSSPAMVQSSGRFEQITSRYTLEYFLIKIDHIYKYSM